MISHSAPTSSYLQSISGHLHIDGDSCPWCEQEIPPEKLEEISGRIVAKEREQARTITAKLEQQYEIDKAQADAKAKADLEIERQQSAAREVAARDEAKKAAEAVAARQLAAAEAGRRALEATLQHQKADAEAARLTAEQAAAAATAPLEQLRQDKDTALAAAKAEAKRREVEIRDEAEKAAEASAAKKLAAAEAGRKALETALRQQKADADAAQLTAEQAEATATAQIEQLRQDKETALAAAKAEAERREIEVRTEAAQAAKAAVAAQLAETVQAVTTAQAKTAEVEGNLAKLSEQHELALAESLKSQREIMEKAKDEAINAERAKTFEETQKLSTKVNELQRALDQKTVDELGEGAEVDLYEALRAEFPEDKIDRVAKGVAGGDVIHVVKQNGRECGTIIYDSKNHKAFRNEHVTKLLADQLAAKAQHAILSTHKFPQGTGQLHMQDGVLLANPARVVAVVTLIRQHLVQAHTLRMSGAERETKTAALYEFITSEHYAQLLARIDSCAEDLLELQVKEKKQHEATWKKQGETLRLIQKVQADVSNQISVIIGTAAAAHDELDFEEAAL
jgi:hypothetical protein